MRSLELPGTPFFVQPVKMGPEDPWHEVTHSTASDKNRFSSKTHVFRCISSPTGHGFGLAFGRWEKLDPAEIDFRRKVERERSLHARYNAVNTPIPYPLFHARLLSLILAWPDLDLDDDEDVEFVMLSIQEQEISWEG